MTSFKVPSLSFPGENAFVRIGDNSAEIRTGELLSTQLHESA